GMRRQVLHEVLLGALESLGGSVDLGLTVADIDAGALNGEPARLTLSDGREVRADLVVAAEGIGSPLRTRFLDAERRPTGLGVWRVD
ncbi:hypothetical protein SB769_37290, partial [Burkholderia sp. SIMBA_024]